VRRLREARDWSLTYFSVHSGLAKTFLRTVETIATSFEMTVAQLMRGI
jgi:hypothetical protein